jgi:hypothetical protein
MIIGGVIATIVGFFIIASLYRLAVKIVAHFAPGYANILVAIIAVIVVSIAASIGMQASGLLPLNAPNSLIFRALILYVLAIIVYGVVIKDKDGQSLGIFKAFLADIVMRLLGVVIIALLTAAAIGIIGYKPVLANIQNAIRQSQTAIAKAQTAAQSIASPTPSAVQSVDQIIKQPPPGPTHYYLKSPITITVAYGQVTYPANTEVHLLGQNGDSCQIQLGASTYTVSRSQLITAQQ